MTKSDLRLNYLEKRSALTANQRSEASRIIAACLFETLALLAVKTLHCFISIPKFNEIDTSLIYGRVWEEYPGIRTVAPRIDRATGEILNLRFESEDEFIENAWGIREPVGDEPVEPAEIDLVIVPLLCFDASGHRVGYGKGFYDRFLAKCRSDCLKIGVSYFPPVPATIDDISQYDVRLDRCITPGRILTFE